MNGQAIIEGDGGLLFTGEVNSRVPPGQPGGGGGGSSAFSLRWNPDTLAIEVTFDGETWVAMVDYEVWDA